MLLIYGSESFARTAAELVRHCGHAVVGFLDDYEHSRGRRQLHPSLATLRLNGHGRTVSTSRLNSAALWPGACASARQLSPRSLVASPKSVVSGTQLSVHTLPLVAGGKSSSPGSLVGEGASSFSAEKA